MHPPAKRRLILLACWLLQAAVVSVGFIFLLGSAEDTGFELHSPGEYLEFLLDPDIQGFLAISIGVLSVLQAVFLFPVRTPRRHPGRGKRLYLALGAAAVFAGVLPMAMVVALLDLLWRKGLTHEPDDMPGIAILVGLGVSWLFFTTLLARYARRSTLNNEDLLTRIARSIFAGTVIEAAALIPLDVLVRRRADCYCLAGTLWAMMLTGAVGVFVAGPAVFIPLLARRPRWLRAGRCGWCGYDRTGLVQAAPCPECGRPPAEGQR